MVVGLYLRGELEKSSKKKARFPHPPQFPEVTSHYFLGWRGAGPERGVLPGGRGEELGSERAVPDVAVWAGPLEPLAPRAGAV